MNMDSFSCSDPTLEMISQHNFDQELSRQLARNDPALTKLHIYGNEIGDTGAASIAQALSFNSSLNFLNLRRNQIGDTGAASIAQAFTFNSTLTELNLDENQVSMESLSSIRKHLKANKHNKSVRAKTIQQLCCASISLLLTWIC